MADTAAPETATSPSPGAVVDAAIVAFAHNGYDDVKLNALARTTGMSKRMIHYHFGNKRGLYLAALKVASARITPPQDLSLIHI